MSLSVLAQHPRLLKAPFSCKVRALQTLNGASCKILLTGTEILLKILTLLLITWGTDFFEVF